MLFQELPISSQTVRTGHNSVQLVTACRCVNIGLFLSGDLRRDTVVDIMIRHPKYVQMISFPGDSLRRVSPDERSISFFMLKAKSMLDELYHGEQRRMSNGIAVRRDGIDTVRDELNTANTFLASGDNLTTMRRVAGFQRGVFVYDVDGTNSDLIGELAENVYRYRTPERFILEINHMMDSN